ncbi:acetyltransferase (GNAT) family protein [Kribbella amoyensis]|uniref:Acetyltransferase (GNAT) family protein n=1 Tax=Kribbella amoyensis TaxID=996641 RepID=A0A561BWD7_9ACTN|nr:GNAT family N-acetyltransferase [Kribbella amoyensis]TWD83181.1 acetyltransferase (GNAT) family protein [Kribbella amoyensis]
MPERLALPSDLPSLPALEVAAGDLFRQIGRVEVAEHPPPTAEVFEHFQAAGRAWVSTDADDRPVGFVLVKLIDGAAHVEQVSVHPSSARQGRGRALIDTVDAWAAARGLPALTLSTFSSVPWNAPYYARLGFRELSADELTPGLVEVLTAEAAIGLDPAERVCMRRETTRVAV